MRALPLLVLVACQHWTHGDTARELMFDGECTVDWYQTERIQRDGQELNPIEGPYGRSMSVDEYMPFALLGHLLVSAALPHDWRMAWQYLTIGSEAATIWSNHENGYGWDGWRWEVR